MSKSNQSRSATQRISDLENAMMSMFNTLDAMTRDFMTIKQAVTLTHSRLGALLKASEQGEALTNENVDRLVVEADCKDLKDKVDYMVTQGVLKAEEFATDSSFVVGQEEDDAGKVITPRIQFATATIGQEEIKSKIVGSKAGQLLDLGEGKLKLRVLESFQIVKVEETQNTASETSELLPNTSAATETTEEAAAETATDSTEAVS
jgi:hypothetical protein